MSHFNYFTKCEVELIELDYMICHGWQPCINITDAGLWHVGLRHNTCEPPKQISKTVDGVKHISWEPMTKHVRTKQTTLKAALQIAIEQAKGVRL